MLASPELPTAGTGLYTLPEAALYSRLHPAVLGRWLFGNKSGGRVLSPQIVDDEQRAVTFLDFIQVRHVRELRHDGRKDDEWIPEVSSGGWLAITCDRRKTSGPKLPQLCRAAGLTHVLVSGTLHGKPQFEKARAVLVVWHDLVTADGESKGAHFSLRYNNYGRPALFRQES